MSTGRDAATATAVKVKVEFTGGLESLFNNTRSHTVSLDHHSEGASPTIRDLILYLTTQTSPGANLSLFIDPECLRGAGTEWTVRNEASITVRPGILVLINDADWELEGAEAAPIAAGDEVVFVSTLHGG